jgi:hypothetical protein
MFSALTEMGKISSLFPVLLLISGTLLAQKLTGLVREEISEYQDYTADPESWPPESRQKGFLRLKNGEFDFSSKIVMAY